MSEIHNSSRIGVYIGDDLLARCDAAMEKTNADSRSEFTKITFQILPAVMQTRSSGISAKSIRMARSGMYIFATSTSAPAATACSRMRESPSCCPRCKKR